jgi:hypothetical protein
MASRRLSAPVSPLCASWNFWKASGLVRMSGRDLNLRRLGAGLDHFGQDLAFLGGIALDRLNQIGNEVGAALILV